MSSSRVSFGSRAGTAFDYPGGEVVIRQSTHSAYNTLDALADALRTEIAAASESDIPECTTLELSLSANAVLELVRPGLGPYSDGGEQDLPAEFKQIAAQGNDEGGFDGGLRTTLKQQRYPRAFVGDTINISDPRQSAIVQRAASRGVVQTIENADGFRYSFNNAWSAKDGEGSRFSYICQDSMQNKDRHANGYPRTTKHLKGDVGSRGPRKPTYDCKGSVSIKFSTTRQCCDIYYRHCAIHATVAARAQIPRPSATRRPFISRGALLPQAVDSDLMGNPSGGLLAMLQAKTYASSALAIADRTEPSNISRPLKRKRESELVISSNVSNKPLSLVELLSQSESAKIPIAENGSNSKQDPSQMPAPIAYDLPSWQVPPPPLNNQRLDGANAGYPPAPYQPPCRPTSHRTRIMPSVAQAQLQPAQHRSPFKQKISGQPSGNHPKAQGLFTTLKPVGNPGAASLPGTMYVPPAVTYSPTATMYQNQSQNQLLSVIEGYPTMQRQRRARTSCVRCRLGKRRCDEGQPCSACAKGGLKALDCVYEGPAPCDADPTSFTPGGNRLPWTAHEKPTGFARISHMAIFPQITQAALVQRLPWETPVSQASGSSRASSAAWRPPTTTSAGTERVSSPDPWFPKR